MFESKFPSEVESGTSNSISDIKLHETLKSDLSRAASIDHGLQYSAIYWEIGHRTWISFFQPLCHKFTTKLLDDQIRRFFQWTTPTSETSFIFYDDRLRLRNYQG